MKCVVTINLVNFSESYKYNLIDVGNLYGCNYELDINANINERLEDLINDNKRMLNDFNKFVKEQNYDQIENDLRLIMDYLNGKIDIKNDIEYIEINLNEEHKENYDDESFKIIKKYIQDNQKFLKNKKVIVSGINKLSREQIECANKYFDKFQNIYYIIEGNSMPIKYADYYNTYKEINEITDKIKSLNLSPLENLMYLYDLFRNRKYKKEEKIEDYNKSRDLTSVLSGDYIVCVGFTELFDQVAKQLGYLTYEYRIKGINRNSHIRNLVYVEDPKYDVDGLYFFDLTWDCKKDENNDFLYSYKFFLKTKEEMEKYDTKKFIKNPILDINDEIIEELKKYDKIGFAEMWDISHDLLLSIGSISKLLNKHNTMDYMSDLTSGNLKTEQIISLFDEYLDKINKPFDYIQFCKLLYNVRKVQHNQNPDFYPFDYDSIKETTINSKIYNELSNEERFIMLLFSETNESKKCQNQISQLEKILKNFDFSSDKQKKKNKW